jgi:hypothetical protein
MKIKNDIDINQFFQSIKKCNGEVFFDTDDGNHLNLKSQLSQFFLAILYAKNKDLLGGEIHLTDPSDSSVLHSYLC